MGDQTRSSMANSGHYILNFLEAAERASTMAHPGKQEAGSLQDNRKMLVTDSSNATIAVDNSPKKVLQQQPGMVKTVYTKKNF
mmetsp:Transcript_37919/g.49813  ORF Transcript_37919/g.49813 Transcript_37919/m.49813 type:complete len:83 (+) Transcript_37919:995-1243(+)|eukprot:CAMPEP_0185587612 /NCGR_PEP_ID=MMETSP0434-20130131/49860_1 /TAXON_ID=626734 ORGANISM="Favella taraikaensis, Strain Fe Narragansett Bay" /NCGR_SAMPLE_ID=MMETSP0434 /ASSEMBLY_ACC=CAM_ASM_000379 /LENGTH=82 /DNA_ID=CAMNT_0028209637 /DNA_START=704 /DNA_END=952 /DNA_ORIENTATION=-